MEICATDNGAYENAPNCHVGAGERLRVTHADSIEGCTGKRSNFSMCPLLIHQTVPEFHRKNLAACLPLKVDFTE